MPGDRGGNTEKCLLGKQIGCFSSKVKQFRGRCLRESLNYTEGLQGEDMILFLSGCLIRQWSYLVAKKWGKWEWWDLTKWKTSRKEKVKAAASLCLHFPESKEGHSPCTPGSESYSKRKLELGQFFWDHHNEEYKEAHASGEMHERRSARSGGQKTHKYWRLLSEDEVVFMETLPPFSFRSQTICQVIVLYGQGEEFIFTSYLRWYLFFSWFFPLINLKEEAREGWFLRSRPYPTFPHLSLQVTEAIALAHSEEKGGKEIWINLESLYEPGLGSNTWVRNCYNPKWGQFMKSEKNVIKRAVEKAVHIQNLGGR